MEKQLENLKTVNAWLQEQIVAFKDQINDLTNKQNTNQGAGVQEQLINLNQQLENLRNELIYKKSPLEHKESMLPNAMQTIKLQEMQLNCFHDKKGAAKLLPKTATLYEDLNALYGACKLETNTSTSKLRILQNCIEDLRKLQEGEHETTKQKGIWINFYNNKFISEKIL